MIQLRRSGVLVDQEDVDRLKAEFHETHCVVIPRMTEPPLLDFLRCRLEQGQWRDKVHEGIGTEIILDDQPAWHAFHFAANAPAFLEAVQEITGCAPLTWFGGRVYRFIPNSGHYDSWHQDVGHERLVGMSLNLSPRGYEGGVFQLRERKSKRVLTEFANTGWGNAILFRIARELEHQVTEVTGVEPKTAFAGWFQSGRPTFKEYLRTAVKR